MTELKEEIEKLNKTFYIAQEKLKTAEQSVKDIGQILKEKYKIDPKSVEDPVKLKALLDKQVNSIQLAKEKTLGVVRALNERITL